MLGALTTYPEVVLAGQINAASGRDRRALIDPGPADRARLQDLDLAPRVEAEVDPVVTADERRVVRPALAGALARVGLSPGAGAQNGDRGQEARENFMEEHCASKWRSQSEDGDELSYGMR